MTSIFEVRYSPQIKPEDAGKCQQVIHPLSAYKTLSEAEARAEEMNIRLEGKTRYWVAEIDTTGAFQIPERGFDKPINRFEVTRVEIPSRPGCWNKAVIHIKDKVLNREVATYERDYPGKPPFYPFRQNEKYYALISRHYQTTAVLDLQTGEVIAEEPQYDKEKKDENDRVARPVNPAGAAPWGFCPVGFYVPDWWDVHDGSILPGSSAWQDSYEWPNGELGFVWGCHWGDDNGWKVQAVDLRRITEGIVLRDERFGYTEIETDSDNPADFIDVNDFRGRRTVRFAVPKLFVLDELIEEGRDVQTAYEIGNDND